MGRVKTSDSVIHATLSPTTAINAASASRPAKFSVGMSNTVTSYAQTNIISIDRDHLELILKDELTLQKGKMWWQGLFSTSLSFGFSAISTRGVKDPFGLGLDIAPLFGLLAVITFGVAVVLLIRFWRTSWGYDFVKSVFESIKEKYSTPTQQRD